MPAPPSSFLNLSSMTGVRLLKLFKASRVTILHVQRIHGPNDNSTKQRLISANIKHYPMVHHLNSFKQPGQFVLCLNLTRLKHYLAKITVHLTGRNKPRAPADWFTIQMSAQARAKARSWWLNYLCHVGGRNPTNQAITPLPKVHFSKKLGSGAKGGNRIQARWAMPLPGVQMSHYQNTSSSDAASG